MKKILNFDHSVSISPSIVVFTVFFLLGIFLLYYVRSVITMLFAAIIIMSAVNPSVNRLQQKLKIPRVIGIAFMYVLLVTLISIAVALIVPPLASEFANFAKYVNFPPIQNELKNFKFTLTEINGLVDSIGGSISTVLGLVTSTFSGLFTVFTMSVMSIYLLLDRENLYKKVTWFTQDQRMLNLAKEYVNTVEEQLGGWVRGQVVLMTIIGFITYFGLLIIGIPYALPLALLAGSLEVLPNLGPTIAAVPSIILAYIFGGWIMAMITLVFYLIVQQLENNLIVPKVMKDNADVNPLTTILAILMGVKLGGVIGALLSVPLYIVTRTLYSMWLREKRQSI
jgi:predicted PurR-regulated permease PerM